MKHATAGPMTVTIVLLLGAALSEASAADTRLRLTTEEYPPFNFTDRETGQIVGMSTDLIRHLMERAGGITYTIEMLPWQRAYNEALDEPATCVFSTTETDKRMPLFKWVGPLVSNDWVFLAAADSEIRIDTLDEARPYIIGGYQGDATALFLQDQGFNVLTAKDDGHNVLLLDAGRIDLWATGSRLGPWLARQQGVTSLKVLHTFRTTQLSLACNKAVPDETIVRLQQVLDGMEADGTADAIRQRYF